MPDPSSLLRELALFEGGTIGAAAAEQIESRCLCSFRTAAGWRGEIDVVGPSGVR